MSALPKTGYHHGNLARHLIQAGLDLIAEKGVRALTLREIGTRTGVSRSAAYRHFADKAKLLNAIRAAGFEAFIRALEEGRDRAGPDFTHRLKGMGLAYVNFARQNPAYFEVMFNTPPASPDCEKSPSEDRAFQILEQLIVEGQAQRAVRPGDSHVIACTAWALVHGISALPIDEALTGPCSDLLLSGLQPPAAKK